MILSMQTAACAGYRSASQIARRVTEDWAASQLYCASCDSDRLRALPCNTPACDLCCGKCGAQYQLKASRRWSELRVPDAGYSAMLAAVRSDKTPNLFVLQYTPTWNVHNLLLVPSFFFSEAAVEQRRPLAPTARRAGWVGCNILLQAIAPEGKLRIVSSGNVIARDAVRQSYAGLRPLSRLDAQVRGWTLDVLRLARGLRQDRFSLTDLYNYEDELRRLHPDNHHVRPKIRQQLQVLRDLGLLEFLGSGSYRLR